MSFAYRLLNVTDGSKYVSCPSAECTHCDGTKSGAPSPVLHKAGLVALTLLLGSATKFPVQLPASVKYITCDCLCCAGSSAISLPV